MNIPNILTIIRFFLIPIFYLVYTSSLSNRFGLSITIFVISGITDILDGYIARKYDMITKWGTILDPLADKLMIITVLFCLSRDAILPKWVFIFILAKEIIMVAGGVNLLRYKEYIPAKYYGKITTLLIYTGVVSTVFSKKLGTIILYAAIAMAIFAFYKYFKSFMAISKKQQQN